MSDGPALAEAREAMEVDEQGNLIVRPLLGWASIPMLNMFVFLRLRYEETPAEFGTEGRSLQMVLTPQQALDLARELELQAKRVLGQPVPRSTN